MTKQTEAMKCGKHYWISKPDGTDRCLVYCYSNPDHTNGKQLGIGFNIADGGGWIPLDDLPADTLIIELREQPAQQQEPEWYHFVSRGEDCFVTYEGQAPADATRLYTAPQPAQRKPLTDEQHQKLRDAFAQALTGVYVCGRVWEAWQYGTMTEDDFQPASECEEVLDSLIEAAHGIKENT
jgi:hypothetical protein